MEPDLNVKGGGSVSLAAASCHVAVEQNGNLAELTASQWLR